MLIHPANSAVTGYNIQRSIRLRKSASASLIRVNSAAPTDYRKFTLSCWIKRTLLGADMRLLDGTSSGFGALGFNSSDQFGFAIDFGSGPTTYYQSQASYRDPAHWAHYHFTFDSSVGSNQSAFSVNNKLQVASVTNLLTLNYGNFLNSASVTNRFGASPTYALWADMLVAEFYFIDGQVLPPTAFGEFDSEIPTLWKPKKYIGSYGANGGYWPFTDNSALTTSSNVGLGKDFSGNGNYWSTNNISITSGVTYDSMTDVPTLTSATASNFAVLNPLVPNAFSGGGVVDNGNLRVTGAGGVSNCFARSTMAISGKMYAEFYFDVVSSTASIGVVPSNDTASNGNLAAQSTNICYRSGGNKRVLGTETAYGASWSANDIIGVVVDTSANTVEFFKNGVSQGAITSSAFFAQGACLFAISTDDTGSPRGFANFGQHPFTYTPPSGFVALNAYNLPDSTIKQGNKHFDITKTTATVSTGTTVSGLAFPIGLMWRKNRDNVESHYLIDVVRGTGSGGFLSSNTTGAAAGYPGGDGTLTFNSDGYTITETNWNAGEFYFNGRSYVDFLWKGGDTPSTNTNGTITSQVSANPLSGVSIITMTGNGVSGATVGHGLPIPPAFWLIKRRDGPGSWKALSTVTGAVLMGELSSAAVWASPGAPMTTMPTSSVITLDNSGDRNGAGQTYLIIAIAPVAGFSAVNVFNGNGASNFVYLGFKPKWSMSKDIDGGSSWGIFDSVRSPYNTASARLDADTSAAEYTEADYDFLSNGIRLTGAALNQNNHRHIMIAFAENPFKYSLAR